MALGEAQNDKLKNIFSDDIASSLSTGSDGVELLPEKPGNEAPISSREERLSNIFSDDMKPELSPEMALDSASRGDPDVYAESMQLSSELNVPRDTAERKMPEMKRRKQLFDIQIEEIKKKNPHLTNYLSNKDNAGVSVDDLISLSVIEDSVSAYDRTWGEFGTDTMIDLGKGIVGMGEMTVGVSDILTFNAVGDALDSIGFDPEHTKRILSDYYSKSRKRADRKIQSAKGFVNTLGAYLEEPAAAFGTIVESSPAMIGIVGAAKLAATKMLSSAGIKAGTPEAAKFFTRPYVIAKLTTVSSGAEGVMTAGQVQEAARREGKSWAETVPYSITSGIFTGLITKGTAKFLPDVEVAAAITPMKGATKKELLTAGKDIAKSMFKEGVLEEAPQSAQEQVFTNLALGKPWDEGVPEATASGMVAGIGMGFAMSTSTEAMAMVGQSERDVKSAINSVSEQATLDNIISYSQESKTNERASGQFESFIESLGPDREVIIPSEIAEQLEGAPDYIAEQINALGTSVSIPMKKFASEIATNEEWMNIVRPHIKLSENTMTQDELDSGERTELQSLLKKAQEAKETLTEADRIYETVKDQIKATGLQGEATARYSAQLYPAAATVYVEKARKAGHDVSISDVFDMMGFKVEAGDIEIDGEPGTILEQAAYKDAPYIFDAARDKFLDVLPEDAEVDEVLETIDEFGPEYRNFIKALERDDWLGFDYPSQAINAALSEELESYEVSPGLKQAIGRMINAEYETGKVFAQAAIPADLEITMESEIIETGEKVQETFNAKELNAEIDDKLDSYKRLRDCLG